MEEYILRAVSVFIVASAVVTTYKLLELSKKSVLIFLIISSSAMVVCFHDGYDSSTLEAYVIAGLGLSFGIVLLDGVEK